MPKVKKVKPSTEALTVLDDLDNRLAQFLKVTELVSEPNEFIKGQVMAFDVIRGLVRQLKKSGKIWRGGYDDATGKVVYSDQVQDFLDEASANELAAELDNDLFQRISKD